MATGSMTSRSRKGMRTKIVWSVFGAGMTLGVALLAMLDPGVQSAGGAGVSLSPLMGIKGSLGMDSIFQTAEQIEDARWSSIVIVHSGSPAGSAADISQEHRELGYDGLGFHFVIGNGTRMGDGEIHVGYRWINQRDGAQLAGAGAGFNSSGVIEICLVGDGDRRPFTDEQLHRLAQVVTSLAERLEIPSDQIYLHHDLAGTTSPGKYFPQAEFEQMLATMG
ncbi:MAG: peptidoglycan recognition family protein [Phycisphaerales bacterium]|nr:peptidoglycan recognition family protein [Phycisphaerales bacterium]